MKHTKPEMLRCTLNPALEKYIRHGYGKSTKKVNYTTIDEKSKRNQMIWKL